MKWAELKPGDVWTHVLADTLYLVLDNEPEGALTYMYLTDGIVHRAGAVCSFHHPGSPSFMHRLLDEEATDVFAGPA